MRMTVDIVADQCIYEDSSFGGKGSLSEWNHPPLEHSEESATQEVSSCREANVGLNPTLPSASSEKVPPEKDAPLSWKEIEEIADMVGFTDYAVLERLVRHLTSSAAVRFPFDAVREQALVWRSDPQKAFATPIKDLFLTKIPLQLGAEGRLGLKSRLSAKLNKDRELEQRINKGVCAVKSATVSQLLEIAEVIGLLPAVIENSKVLSTPNGTPTRRRSLLDVCQSKAFASRGGENSSSASTGINNISTAGRKRGRPSSSSTSDEGAHEPAAAIEDDDVRPKKRRRSSASTAASSEAHGLADLVMTVDLPPKDGEDGIATPLHLQSVIAPCATDKKLLTQEDLQARIARGGNPSPLATRRGKHVGLSAYSGGGRRGPSPSKVPSSSRTTGASSSSSAATTGSSSGKRRSSIGSSRRRYRFHSSPSSQIRMCNADGTIRRLDSQMQRGWPKDDDYAHAWLAACQQTTDCSQIFSLVDNFMKNVQSPEWRITLRDGHCKW